MSEEVIGYLEKLFDMEFYVNEYGTIFVKCGYSLEVYRSQSTKAKVTTEEIGRKVAKSFVDRLANAISMDGYQVQCDRVLFFGEFSGNTWRNRLTSPKAENLYKIFEVDHRQTSDGVYNVVIYTPKHPKVQKKVKVFYRKENSKIRIESEYDSHIYKGLLKSRDNQAETVLSIKKSANLGISTDGVTGAIEIGSGLKVGQRLVEVKVKYQEPKLLVLYMADISRVSYEPKQLGIKTTISEHTFKVEPGTNLIVSHTKETTDHGVFPWTSDVNSVLDLEINPITERSSFAHLIKPSTPGPKYATDALWISSEDNVYANDDGKWILLPINLECAELFEKYIKPEFYAELQRFFLAEKLKR